VKNITWESLKEFLRPTRGTIILYIIFLLIGVYLLLLFCTTFRPCC